MGELFCGDCKSEILKLPDNAIRACITSPPYANQRKQFYASISEKDYPAWTVEWLEPLKKKLSPDGSVLIVIRPHLSNGEISDYVLRTRLAVREAGWKECEELIWLKTDAPPLGSIKRPRRTWESILWFSQTANPFVALRACGEQSSRIGGFAGSQRFGLGNILSTKQGENFRTGKSRCSDVFSGKIGEIERGIMHPAMFPITLAEKLILTFSSENDFILDPFCGSGTTLLAAWKHRRDFFGVDTEKKYLEIAKSRLEKQNCMVNCH